MTLTNEQVLDQAQQLARLKIAQRCQKDLFFLDKYILGYDLMTDNTHKTLCNMVENIPLNRQFSANSEVSPRGGHLTLSEKSTLPASPSEITPHSTAKLDISEVRGEIKHYAGAHTKNLPSQLGTVSGRGAQKNLEVSPETINSLQPLKTETSNEMDLRAGDHFDPNNTDLLLMMPRGTFKSSVVTIGYTLQFLLNNPDARVLIDSETFSKAKAFFAEIKGHLEGNDMFREVYFTIYGSYPDSGKRDNLWSDSQLNLSCRKRKRKEPSISCGGVDVTKNGMHYDLIIMDDLHSEVNTQNKDQIDKVIQHYKLSRSLLDPGCPLIVIGTRWHYLDVYQHILDEGNKSWNILIRSAYNEDGSLFFPERLTQQFLEATRATQGGMIFSCQYLNSPVDDENAMFKASDIQIKPWDLVKDVPMNWYMLVDPSFGGQYSDYCAIVIAGMDFMRQLYVRHIVRRKMTYAQIIDEMFALYHEYPIRQIAIETVATQKSISYMLHEEQINRGEWLPITEFKSRSHTKEERVRGLAPFYENHRIFHVKECNQREELEYELLHFPKAKHDDVVDALANVLEIANPAGANRHRVRRRDDDDDVIYLRPRSSITGV